MPFIIGQSANFDKIPLLAAEERKLLVNQAQALLQSGQPLDMVAGLPALGLVRAVVTLSTYEDLVRDLSDALDSLAKSETAEQMAEAAHDYAALVEAARVALAAPLPVFEPPKLHLPPGAIPPR